MNNIINTKNKLNQDAILKKLRTFSGTKSYFRHSSLFPRFLLTEGALYLAKACSCYWLFDYLASQQNNPVIKDHKKLQIMQFWELTAGESTGVISCEWADERAVHEDQISFTAFPLESIRIWIAPTMATPTFETLDNKHMVAMLPSEY
ncbi:MAG: hypothetical protein F6K11_10220 [Leptolyngbya sp. SIO3F4]|nr:hypothetical protein [Leptolyngbya sp. SIO3F4]